MCMYLNRLIMEKQFNRQRREGKEGFDYEDQVLTHLAIVCATHKDVQDFIITGNAKEVKKVDDVILDVCYKNGNKELFAFQIKHKSSNCTDLFYSYGKKSAFDNVGCYQEGYEKLRNDHNERKVTTILWTNYNFQTKDWFEFNDPNSILYPFNMPDGKIYQLNIKHFLKLKKFQPNEDFFNNCFVFVNQPNKEDAVKLIRQDLGCEIFSKTCTDIFKYFEDSEAENLTKKQIIQALIYLILRPCFECYSERIEDLRYFRTIINSLNRSVLVIENCTSVKTLQLAQCHFIRDYFKLNIDTFNWDIELPPNVIKAITMNTELMDHAKIKHKWEVLSSRDLFFLLWSIGKIPLLVNCNDSNNSQFSVITEKIQEDYLKGLVIIKKNEEHKKELTGLDFRKIAFSFDNKSEITLEELVGQDKDVIKVITPDVYLNLMANANQFTQDASICDIYITRKIKIVAFRKDVLQEKSVLFSVHEKTNNSMELATYFDRFKTSQKNNTVFNCMDVNVLHSTKSQFNTVKNMVLLKRSFCCLCEYKGVYLCYAGSDICVNRLAAYRCKEYFITENELSQTDFPINFCVLSATAGMGKSELLLFIKQTAPRRIWTIYLNLGIHATKLNEIVKTNKSAFLDYLVAIQNENKVLNAFYKQLLEKRLNTRNVYLLLDGFDEVELDLKVIDLAIDLKFRIIMSTRSYKMTKLQNLFFTPPMDLIKFDRTDLYNYFKKHLQEFGDNLIQQIVEKLNETISEDIIGIPLLAKHFLDICKTPSHFEIIKNKISILFLFEEFFKRHYSQSNSLERNIQELATHFLIKREALLEDLIIDVDQMPNVAADIKSKSKKEFIITGFTFNYLPVFVHRTYAEFACAQLLYLKRKKKNFCNVYDVLHSREDLFQVLYYFNLLICRNMPLHYSILNKKGQLECLNQILEKDELGRNILHLICSFGESSFSRPYLDNGLEWYYRIAVNRRQKPFGIDINLFKILLENILNMGLKQFLNTDKFGKSPYDYSFSTLCLDHLDFICSKTNETLPIITYKYTIFYIAIRYRLNDILKNAHPSDMEVFNSENNFVTFILEENDLHNSTEYRMFQNINILHLAAYYENLEATKMFLCSGNIDINSKDVRNGETPLHLILQKKDINMVLLDCYLEKDSLDINCADSYGATPLLLISLRDEINLDIFKKVIHHPKINLNYQDVAKRNVLHLICDSINCGNTNNKLECLKLLLKTGKINVNCKNMTELTPLHLICHLNSQEINIEALRLLLQENDIDVNARDENQRSVLDHMCFSSTESYKLSIEALKMLVQHRNINVNAVNQLNMTALHCFCSGYHTHDLLEGLTVLLGHKDIDINCKDNRKMTPFHYLCKLNLNEVEMDALKLLLQQKNLDVHCRDCYGKRAIDYLPEARRAEVQQLISEYFPTSPDL